MNESVPYHRLALTMPSFLDSVESCFSTRDIYEALGVEKTAKEGELRRAYHRLSLKVHPDRVTSDQVQEATEKFQVSYHTRRNLKLFVVGMGTNPVP